LEAEIRLGCFSREGRVYPTGSRRFFGRGFLAAGGGGDSEGEMSGGFEGGEELRGREGEGEEEAPARMSFTVFTLEVGRVDAAATAAPGDLDFLTFFLSVRSFDLKASDN
jgi:hypothetical protein